MKIIQFVYIFPNDKKLIFSSKTQGLVVDGKEFLALSDGHLIYDKTKNLHADAVTIQLSTNTSTLIPALRILGIPYHSYFDEKDVVTSQNNILFYLKRSRLAAFYNRFGTDGLHLDKREAIIKKAIGFLVQTAKAPDDFLPIELLDKMQEPCKLLGFYEGFPIFDSGFGIPMLVSRLGIHVGKETVMISTPYDRYAKDIEEIAEILEKASGQKGIRKKNRIRFEKTEKLLSVLGVS